MFYPVAVGFWHGVRLFRGALQQANLSSFEVRAGGHSTGQGGPDHPPTEDDDVRLTLFNVGRHAARNDEKVGRKTD